MGPILVRSADPEDKPERLRVTEQAWRAAYAEFIPSPLMEALFRGEVQESSSYAASRSGMPVRWLAETEGLVVGHIGFVCRQEEMREVGEISPLYVSPDYQGRGVGKMLLDVLEVHIREQNLPELWVFALKQGPAIGFYERQGFESVRSESLRIDETEFEVSAMRKILLDEPTL